MRISISPNAISEKKKKKKAKKKKGDRCTRIAKRKYDVWPSAYASGAVVRCRKGEIWKGLKEDDDVRDKYGSEVADRSKRSLKKSLALAEDQEGLQSKIRKALRDEGGAAGMDALEKHTEASAAEIRKAIKEMDEPKGWWRKQRLGRLQYLPQKQKNWKKEVQSLWKTKGRNAGQISSMSTNPIRLRNKR